MGYFPAYYGPAIYDLNFDWGRQSSKLLAESIQGSIPSESTILDMGTGTGNLALMLASQYPKSSVTGVDVEQNAIIVARHRAKLEGVHNVTFLTGDAYCLDFPDHRFDVVVASQLFGDQGKVLDEAGRVLCPGGLVAFVRPHAPRSQMLRWRNDTLREFARRHGCSVSLDGMMMKSYSRPEVFSELLAARHIDPIRIEEIDAPHGDGWAQHILTLMNSEHPFEGIRKRIATIMQVAVDDQEAITTGFYDFFSIGIELLNRSYGGAVATSFLLVVGKKGIGVQ